MKRAIAIVSMLASVAGIAEPTELPNYNDWYQVEIIVFAQKNPPRTDEAWPAQQITYPKTMVTIAPQNIEGLRPYDLSQLKELSLSPGDILADDSDLDDPGGFLFESRSRANRARLFEHPDETETVNPENSALPDLDVDVTPILNAGLPTAFHALDPQYFVLDKVAGSVNRSSRYRLLLHTAWRQPVPSAGDAWPVLIQAGQRYANQYELDGTLTVSRARFLHVEANLWFTEFVQKYEGESPLPEIVREVSHETLREFPELLEAERSRDSYLAVQNHRMQTSRRMRSATLHYIDNPFFGVLVQIDGFTYQPSPLAER